MLKILSDKNAFLSTIILSPPTLSVYHQAYTDFFVNYDQNLDLYSDSQKTLNQEVFPKYHEHSAALKDVTSLKLDNSLSMLTVKKYLVDKINLIPSQKRLQESQSQRELILSDRENSRPERQLVSKLPSNDISKIIARLDSMKDKITTYEHNRADMQSYLKDIEQKSEGLYLRCFELIDNFGKFYLMTSRLWITTENIYQFYKSKANEVIDEMKMIHFKNHSNKKKNIKLLFLQYKSWARVSEFVRIEINSERRSLLMCTIKAEVSEGRLHLGGSFDFFLALNNVYNPNRRSFEYKIQGKNPSVLIPQILEVQPGINKIDLFGIITGDYIIFSKLYVNCVNLIEFKQIVDPIK